MSTDDDRPGEYGHFYSDTGYFTKGRSAWHPDPKAWTHEDRITLRYVIGAGVVLILLFIAVHFAMPTVK